MPNKISTAEPAERPFTVALSTAEVLALHNYHFAQAKRITRKIGQVTMNMLANHTSSGELKTALGVAKAMTDAHLNRAKGLHSILK